MHLNILNILFELQNMTHPLSIFSCCDESIGTLFLRLGQQNSFVYKPGSNLVISLDVLFVLCLSITIVLEFVRCLDDFRLGGGGCVLSIVKVPRVAVGICSSRKTSGWQSTYLTRAKPEVREKRTLSSSSFSLQWLITLSRSFWSSSIFVLPVNWVV